MENMIFYFQGEGKFPKTELKAGSHQQEEDLSYLMTHGIRIYK